jgi:SPX domain protein involved in polyphosphate accumulation
MKFAKYLESQSVPEWRKAYINYKGLKKRLKQIEKVNIALFALNDTVLINIQLEVSKSKRAKSSNPT